MTCREEPPQQLVDVLDADETLVAWTELDKPRILSTGTNKFLPALVIGGCVIGLLVVFPAWLPHLARGTPLPANRFVLCVLAGVMGGTCAYLAAGIFAYTRRSTGLAAVTTMRVLSLRVFGMAVRVDSLPLTSVAAIERLDLSNGRRDLRVGAQPNTLGVGERFSARPDTVYLSGVVDGDGLERAIRHAAGLDRPLVSLEAAHVEPPAPIAGLFAEDEHVLWFGRPARVWFAPTEILTAAIVPPFGLVVAVAVSSLPGFLWHYWQWQPVVPGWVAFPAWGVLCALWFVSRVRAAAARRARTWYAITDRRGLIAEVLGSRVHSFEVAPKAIASARRRIGPSHYSVVFPEASGKIVDQILGVTLLGVPVAAPSLCFEDGSSRDTVSVAFRHINKTERRSLDAAIDQLSAARRRDAD